MIHLSRPSAATCKRITINYLGGVGYYTIIFALLLWFIDLYMKLETYILFKPQMMESYYTATSTVPSASSSGVFSTIFIYLLTALMICVTLVLIVIIPYGIGHYTSRVFRKLFAMTNQTPNLTNLFIYKMLCCSAIATSVLFTTYNYHLETTDNWFSVLLLSMSAGACLLFWLQHLLAKLWKVPFKKVF